MSQGGKQPRRKCSYKTFDHHVRPNLKFETLCCSFSVEYNNIPVRKVQNPKIFSCLKVMQLLQNEKGVDSMVENAGRLEPLEGHLGKT